MHTFGILHLLIAWFTQLRHKAVASRPDII